MSRALAHGNRPEIGDFGYLNEQLPSCILGEHEDCPGVDEGWTNYLDVEGSRYIQRCACGCHRLDPWPWETSDRQGS